MLIKATGATPVATATVVSLRCPGCRRVGTFDAFGNVNDVHVGGPTMGQRRCPNPECAAHVFFVWSNEGRRLSAAYPAERIDFDTTGVPPEVTGALEEAITCHAASCFRAAAVIVHQVIEELCKDRGASGSTLKDRLKKLSSTVVMPQEFLDAMDDLRLLGNDAAHVESQEYSAIGQAEVEAGIAVAKEILKAVYQYAALVSQLRALRKNP